MLSPENFFKNNSKEEGINEGREGVETLELLTKNEQSEGGLHKIHDHLHSALFCCINFGNCREKLILEENKE